MSRPRRDRSGRLLIGGVPATEIVRRYGTPAYAYSLQSAADRYKTLERLLPDIDVFYSLKANPHPSICRLFGELGAGAEVTGEGELEIAARAGFSPRNIVMVSPVKSDRDILAALRMGVYAVVAESVDEVERIDRLARGMRGKAPILVRVNCRYRAAASRERMGGTASKFGVAEEHLAGLRLERYRNVSVLGLHSYMASQVNSAPALARHARHLAGVAGKFHGERGLAPACIDFGGGLGVRYGAGDPALDLAGYARSINGLTRRFRAAHPGVKTRFILELGRFLVADSGFYLCRVTEIRRSRGTAFALLDGGMHQFLRPVFMKTRHEAVLASRLPRGRRQRTVIAGSCCTPLDVLHEEAAFPPLKAGDILAFLMAGAYGLSMSPLLFHTRRPPVEVSVAGGRMHATSLSWRTAARGRTRPA